MVIPTRLTLEKVKKAALAFAKTEDEANILHPECIITTMPYEEAILLHLIECIRPPAEWFSNSNPKPENGNFAFRSVSPRG
jgi:hypothetical protein